MSKKKKDEIVVSFLGGQSEYVTGSSVLVSVLNDDDVTRCNVLLELGMIQGEGDIFEDFKANKRMIENIPLKDIDYTFICHAHADHLGNLPCLSVNDKVKIITTKKNYKIMKPMLLDAVYIHGKTVEYLCGKGHRVKHLYKEPDFWQTYDKIETYEEGEIYELTDKISFRFLPNSHLIGSTQLELFIKKRSGTVKKIVYTSDLGGVLNKENQYFLTEQPMVNKADLLLIESTYGDRAPYTKAEVKKEKEDLFKTIKKYLIGDRKDILIPAFSLGRIQNLMCMLYDEFKDNWDYRYKIVVDTTLGNKINEIYDSILEGEELEYWHRVRAWGVFEYIRDYKSSVAFMSRKQPSLILSSSGMLSAGRAIMWAERVLGESGGLIAFVGYCGNGTTGREILDGKEVININGHTVLKRCDIKRYHTFSGHAQRDTLLNYIKQVSDNCTIILHHGDKGAKEELKRLAEEELRKSCKTNKIIISKKNMQITL